MIFAGSFGGAIQNPIHALASFVAGLHFANGSVSIPGFYKGVRDIEPEDKADVAAFPFIREAFLEEIGGSEEVGEEGFHTLERLYVSLILFPDRMGNKYLIVNCSRGESLLIHWPHPLL